MVYTQKVLIDKLRTIGTDMVDQRIVTEQELRSLVWFLHYGQNVFSQIGGEWVGAVFRQRGTKCTLSVKATFDGIPQVAFVTDRNPIGCVVAFAKLWFGDRVKWYPDKYP